MSQSLIRRERLQAWMHTHALTVADVSRAYGSKNAYIRSILHMGDVQRNIGEKARDKLEEALGMPAGFLDGETAATKPSAPSLRAIGDVVDVPLLYRSKSVNKLDPAQATPIPLAMLEHSGTKPESAAWLRVEGADMSPVLIKGSLALINLEEREVLDGKVYVLGWQDSLTIRRVHRTPTGFLLSVESNTAATLALTTAEFKSQVSVAGRIRATFNSLD